MPPAALRTTRGKIKQSLHRIAWNREMPLAVIFVVSIFCTSSPAAAATHQTAAQSEPAAQSSESAPSQSPPTSSQATPAAATPATTSAGKAATPPAERPRHKKRILPPNCDNAPAAASQTSAPAPGDP